MLDRFILDGTVTILAIVVLALEFVVLSAFGGASARPITKFAANIVSGFCLIMALRASLLASGATMIGLWLGLGFVAHLADLVQRLRR